MSRIIPREGQPCLDRNGDPWKVVRLSADDEGLNVGVQPWPGHWRARTTTMSLAQWRLLFEVPPPPD